MKKNITLDGEPAVVAQKEDGFFVVKRLDGRGGDVEFSQTAVTRILSKDANFIS